MPLYKARSTGELVSRSEDYVSAFPAGTFALVKNEPPTEAKERQRQEAPENKVDIENDAVDEKGKK